MMRIALLLCLLLSSCRAYPARHPDGPAAGGGGGALAPGGDGGAGGPGGSGASGGLGGSGGCEPLAMPVVALTSTGDPSAPGAFLSTVIEHRAVEPDDDVPPLARGATRLLHLYEIRGADVHRYLWYRAPEGFDAPVRPNTDVRLFYQEYQPAGRSAGAVLRDAQGKLLWAILDGSFEPLGLTSRVVELEPVGEPICSFEACGIFDRRVTSARRRGEVAQVRPGLRGALAGGRLALVDHLVTRELTCTETPLEQLGWAFLAGDERCGARGAPPCSADELCRYPAHRCGADDRAGTCEARPLACEDAGPRACGCDGQVYRSACWARTAGVDVGTGCAAPRGTFACGPFFCEGGAQYCRHAVSDVPGVPDDFACRPLPPCAGAGCACVRREPCGDVCSEDAVGHPTVTCPGG